MSNTSSSAADRVAHLRQEITDRQALVGVIGLGYVGLPLILSLAERGFRTLGFDVDQSKVTTLENGETYIQQCPASRIRPLVEGGALAATADFGRLGEPDVLLICVPTPLTAQREPDMSYIVATAQRIVERLRPGQLVVLESTTYPGTTEELLRSMLEGGGLACGEDFFLGYSPEREDPGNTTHSTTTIPKVVGGVDERSADLTQALYDQIVPSTVRVSSARAAEATKLTENIFRAVNIALVNELKIVYDRMGIDIWEVLDAASTKPFGFMRFNPGPGWGGHCIPLDPFYLSWKARESGAPPRFIELAGEVNVTMTGYVIEKLQRALNGRSRAVRGSKILVLGIAYKKNVADPRESPAFELIDRLLDLGAEVSYHDPLIAEAPAMRTWSELPPMHSVPLTAENLAAQDAVLVVTDHDAIDWQRVHRHAPLIVDTRGIYRTPDDKVVKA
ncbi:MAG: nucleotide sugar dehydrogenase [Acidobacteriota bacterium]